jgi:putative ABC transport system permease protein
MSWWGRLIRRGRAEAQLDDELRDHVERQVADSVQAGMSEPEARRRTRVDFGGLDQVKEQCRDARGTRLIEDLVRDVRYAGRTLRKSPGFTVAAIASLALGIGANTAIFSLIDAAILKSLPVREPERLIEGHHQHHANLLSLSAGWTRRLGRACEEQEPTEPRV